MGVTNIFVFATQHVPLSSVKSKKTSQMPNERASTVYSKAQQGGRGRRDGGEGQAGRQAEREGRFQRVIRPWSGGEIVIYTRREGIHHSITPTIHVASNYSLKIPSWCVCCDAKNKTGKTATDTTQGTQKQCLWNDFFTGRK